MGSIAHANKIRALEERCDDLEERLAKLEAKKPGRKPKLGGPVIANRQYEDA